VDGDRTSVEVDVSSGAAAFVSSQASTKVYRSPRGTHAALHGRVKPGGLLVVAPDPTVCFADSRYSQSQRFEVEGDGALVVVDTLLSGRSASGERWAFVHYQALAEVLVDGRLILHDPLVLRAGDGDLASRMGRFEALALIVVVGAQFHRNARQLVDAASAQPIEPRAKQLMAAYPLGGHGCLVRIAGTCSEQVRRTVRELLAFIPPRLGDDPWLRKW
jgi:urease accessory protein